MMFTTIGKASIHQFHLNIQSQLENIVTVSRGGRLKRLEKTKHCLELHLISSEILLGASNKSQRARAMSGKFSSSFASVDHDIPENGGLQDVWVVCLIF